jgi:hypothetical protein
MLVEPPIGPGSGPNIFRFVVCSRQRNDPRSASFLADAHTLGLAGVTRLECSDLYFIEGKLSALDLQRIGSELLSDSITQTVEWSRFVLPTRPFYPKSQPYFIEVALHPVSLTGG